MSEPTTLPNVLVNVAEGPGVLAEGRDVDRSITEETQSPRTIYGQLVHPRGQLLGQGLGKLAVLKPRLLGRCGVSRGCGGTFSLVFNMKSVFKYVNI